MFGKFGRAVAFIFTFILLSSCSYPDRDMVTITVPRDLPIVDISGESPYMDLFVFDGRRCFHRFISAGQVDVTVPVMKGALCLFTITPYGRYSSVSAYLEPGMDRPSRFSPLHSQLIVFLTDVAMHNPGLVADADMSSIIGTYPDTDRVDRMKLLEYLEKGDPGDPSVPDLEAAVHHVGIDTYIPGLWRSDRDDMADIVISHMGDDPVLELPEGIYHYFHEDGRHHLMIVVASDGRHSSRLDLTAW